MSYQVRFYEHSLQGDLANKDCNQHQWVKMGCHRVSRSDPLVTSSDTTKRFRLVNILSSLINICQCDIIYKLN